MTKQQHAKVSEMWFKLAVKCEAKGDVRGVQTGLKNALYHEQLSK